MRGIDWLQNVHWLLTYFAAGWVLGWLAVRDRRWAVVPALGTVLVMVTGLAGSFQTLLRLSSDLTRTAVAAGLGLLLLWGASRLPSLTGRVGAAAVLVPPVAALCLSLGFLLFLVVFQIP